MQVETREAGTAAYQTAVGDDDKHLHDYSTAMWKETGNYHINIPNIGKMNCQLNVKNSGRKIVSHSDVLVETTSRYAKWRYKRNGIWNVRSLGSCVTSENLILEMKRLNIDILGVNEIRWPECDDFWSNKYRFVLIGSNNKHTGVGFLMN